MVTLARGFKFPRWLIGSCNSFFYFNQLGQVWSLFFNQSDEKSQHKINMIGVSLPAFTRIVRVAFDLYS